MKDADFISECPGQLVPTVEGAQAFVPVPIPRQLQLPSFTWRLQSDADDAVGRLAGVVARLVNPWLVAYPLMRREAILSSRIEGTHTTAEDLVLLDVDEAQRPALPPHSRKEDTLEVANYIRAMEHGLARLKEIPVSLRLIRDVHAVLLKDVRGGHERPGEFRTLQNFIGDDGDRIAGARFVPPPVTQMLALLDDFEKYLHEETDDSPPLLIRLALIHYQFETIHPFRDGNGRLGRLLLALMLCSSERLVDPTLYLSGYFDQNRDEYMDRLLLVSQRGDWVGWINFFLKGVAECAKDSREQAEGLIALRDNYLGRFRAARSSGLLQTLIEDLFKQPSMRIGDAVDLLGVSHAAASYNLKKLEAAGIVREITGRRRNQIYYAAEIVRFSQDVENRPRPEGAIPKTRST